MFSFEYFLVIYSLSKYIANLLAELIFSIYSVLILVTHINRKKIATIQRTMCYFRILKK